MRVGMVFLDFLHGRVRQVVVMRVADDDGIHVRDVMYVAWPFCVSFETLKIYRRAAILEHGVKQYP